MLFFKFFSFFSLYLALDYRLKGKAFFWIIRPFLIKKRYIHLLYLYNLHSEQATAIQECHLWNTAAPSFPMPAYSHLTEFSVYLL